MKQFFSTQQQTLLLDLCERYASTSYNEVLQIGSVYLEKLLYYNRTVPLISRAGDQKRQAAQLFLTSLAALEFLPREANISAIDIGSGGGFPALPLKIARPDINWRLIEVRQRKCTVLTALISHLGLIKISAANGRYEDFVANDGDPVEIVTARAGPPPAEVVAWARSLPGLRRVLVFESSAKRDLAQYSGVESDFYLLSKKEVGIGHDVNSLWILSFEKRQ
ncbi:MAG: hypothetical protein GY869_23955 [Planctomycetes bacterium]|nr:hypothetical protein [Planctomycetota bacterium]